MKIKTDKLIMMIAGVSLLTAPLRAAVLYSDDFTSGSKDGWYHTATNGTSTLNASNGYLEFSAPSDPWAMRHGVYNFPAADLSNVGDTVNLSMKFKILENIGTATIGMGLWDSKGTKITSDVADFGNGTDDAGYYIYRRDDRDWLKDSYGKGIGDINGVTSLVKQDNNALFTTADGLWHTYDLTLERTAGGMLVTLVTDKGLATERTLAGGSANAVDRVDEIVLSTFRYDYAVDDVVVTYGGVSAGPNSAPVFSADPIVKAGGTNGVAYSGSLAGSAADADDDPLEYSKVSGPDWLAIASDGSLSGTPGTADEGTNSWTVSVSDGLTNDTATLNIAVTYTTNHPPVFSSDPIEIAAGRVDVTYSGSLSGSAADVDSDALAYSKLSGPDWLTIASDGALSGTPGTADEGTNSWSVQVSDGLGGTNTATLNITVGVVLDGVLFSDDFSDNNRDGWYQTLTNGVRVLDASGGTLQLLDPSDAFGQSHAVAPIPVADLSVVGATVKLTLKYRILEYLSGQTIGIGLWSSEDSPIASDLVDYGAGTNDVGYFIYNRPGRYWLKDSTVGIGNINGSTSLAKSGTEAFGVADAIWHTYSLELERTGTGSIRVTLITDEGMATETVLTASSGIVADRIDQIVLSTYGKDYEVDDVVVEASFAAAPSAD